MPVKGNISSISFHNGDYYIVSACDKIRHRVHLVFVNVKLRRLYQADAQGKGFYLGKFRYNFSAFVAKDSDMLCVEAEIFNKRGYVRVIVKVDFGGGFVDYTEGAGIFSVDYEGSVLI